MWSRILKYFKPEYQVTIWHPDQEPVVLVLRKVKTSSTETITGTDLKGNPYTYHSPDPFKYEIRKL